MPDFAALLAARRAELEDAITVASGELAGIQGARADATADDEHDPEGSTLSGDWSRIVGVRSALVAQLGEVERAFARLAAGGYGVCVACGRGIPEARLAVRPTAERCVACST